MRWLRLIPGLLRLLSWWKQRKERSQRVMLVAHFPSALLDELEEGLEPTEMLVLDPTERMKLRLAVQQLERIAGTSIALHSFHISKNSN